MESMLNVGDIVSKITQQIETQRDKQYLVTILDIYNGKWKTYQDYLDYMANIEQKNKNSINHIPYDITTGYMKCDFYVIPMVIKKEYFDFIQIYRIMNKKELENGK